MRGNFLPNEAESILSIPISHNFPDDALVWALTQNGRFTVRSAYKVACNWPLEERSKTSGGEESNPKKRSEFWSYIWRLNYPSKVRQFMWRACKNILPTNYCLKFRKVTMVDECGVCGKVESSGHALWDCEVAKSVWKETKLSLPKFQNPQQDFIDVVWKLSEDRREISWETLATTTWCIWKNRNVTKFEGLCKLAKAIAKGAELLVEEFSSQNSVPKQVAPPRIRG